MNAKVVATPCCFPACETHTGSSCKRSFTRPRLVVHGIADVICGATFGAIVAVTHFHLVPRSAPSFPAVLIAISVVMLLQMVLCFALGAVIGSMEAMLPGNIAGMLVMVGPSR